MLNPRLIFGVFLIVCLGACSPDQAPPPSGSQKTKPSGSETPAPRAPAAKTPAPAQDSGESPEDKTETPADEPAVPKTLAEKLNEGVFDSDAPAKPLTAVPTKSGSEKYWALARRAKTEGAQEFFTALAEDNTPMLESDKNGGGIFHWLAATDRADLAKALVEEGLTQSLNSPDKDMRLPLHLATSAEMAQALWNAQAAWSVDRNGQNPMIHMAAVEKAAPALIFTARRICNHPGFFSWISTMHPINYTDKHGRTALHYAAINSDLQGIDALLSCSATRIDMRDNSQRTPLHYVAAALRRSTGAAYALLRKNREGMRGEKQKLAFINAQDMNGDTALHIAVRCQNERAVRLLKYFGADQNIRNLQRELAADQSSDECPVAAN